MGQLENLFNEIELSECLALFINDCLVDRVLVCEDTKTWTMKLKSKISIKSTELNEFKLIISRMFPHVVHFNIEIETINSYLNEFNLMKWKLLCVYLANNIPVAGTFLSDASFVINEDKLIITVNYKPGFNLFKNKLADSARHFIKNNWGLDFFVEFAVTAATRSSVDLKKELQEHVKNACQLISNPGPDSRQGNVKSILDSPLIFGRNNFTKITAIQSIIEEEKNITVGGEIFNLAEKTFKTGRRLVTFAITDKIDSINVKLFLPEKSDFQFGKLKNNSYLLINGSVQFDTYDNELIFMAKNIKWLFPVEIEDNASEKRVELHLHSKMSAMDGVSSLEQYFAQAAKWCHPAIAITDHGVLQAFPEAFELGKKYKLKVVYGVEAYLADDQGESNDYLKTSSYHVILLVKNYEGLKNLYRLVSLSHLEYFYRRPKIPKSILASYRKGLLVGSACEAGELISRYLQGDSTETLKKIADFYDFLEIQPIDNNKFLIRQGLCTENDLQKMNKIIIKLGEELDKMTVATGDVHFLNPEDAIFRQILMHGKGFEDANFQPPLFYRNTEQMLAAFNYLDKETAYRVVITNPREIAAQIEEIKPIPDEFFPPQIPGAEEQIMEMTWANARKLYSNIIPEIVEKRIKKELESITNNGFAVLYLIAHKLVKKSNEDGYLVGSRGSVGSSLVATLTGITEVNPLPPHYRCVNCRHSNFIEDGSVGCGADLPDQTCPNCSKLLAKDGHDIPFEVFLGFKGDKVPDIDLNFSGDYQGTVMKFAEELFGKEYVFRAGTIATVAERTAFGFVKKFLEETNRKVRTAELDRLVRGCTGVKRTTGQHPGGLMVVPRDKDIYDFTPVQYPADDQKATTVTTHFDYNAISSRLVKLDLLGHDDPTVIKMLEDLTGIDAKTIPLDEGKTMSVFSGTAALEVTTDEIRSPVGTYGIPEFGTRFVRQMLEDTQPKTFSELVRISGFSHGTDVWLNNAQDLIKQGIAKLSEVISARDDIMVYLIYQGMDPVEAFNIMESVRKGKGVLPDQEETMIKANVPKWYIDSCKKIKYMFPKAHAVAYVMMAFRIAYYKVYYPEAFYASFFTVRADEFDSQLICQGSEAVMAKIIELEQRGNEATVKEKNLLIILEVALEMFKRGIKMLRVSLNDSQSHKFTITSKGILPPLASLQGVGKIAAGNILTARLEKPFHSVEDLRVRSKISKTVIEALDTHGCIVDLPITSQLELF